MKLPRHFNARPTLVHCHVELTIDGGDIRQDAMQKMIGAVENAFAESAGDQGLDTCFSRTLRSTDPTRFRKALRLKGFRLPALPSSAPDQETRK